MSLDPQAQEQFATEIVARLREHHYEAFWAGGCVRDRILNLQPKDYDVATNARPDVIRNLFGHRRTLPIGAAFGVIAVLGPRQAGNVEVATFRRDAPYSDGRRPDSVEYCDAQEDAKRRDFTINGLFFDPLTSRVIDYVDGQEDLRLRRIRAIGNAEERISEDKLRMLRGVRFAATFDFEICRETMQAIRRRAPEISVVSMERIGAEVRRMLVLPRCAMAADLLEQSGLLAALLRHPRATDRDDWPDRWDLALNTLSHLASFATEAGQWEAALAALLRPCGDPAATAVDIARHWRLSNQDVNALEHLLHEEPLVRTADQRPWSQLQPILAGPFARHVVNFSEATARALNQTLEGVDFCRRQLLLPPAELDPPPLLTGQDLIRLGRRPGPDFKALLQAVRDAQLDGQIRTHPEALEYLDEIST